MAAIAADRDLLFGLIALQNGLIDQDQLVNAFRAWTRDKARSLADHLQARGDLTVAKRALLDALAEVHLEAHDGDVEKSLAAVPANRSTRASLADLGEPEVDATLARIARGKNGHATERDDDPDRTAALSLGGASSDGQRFHLLRPHARGGLGEVFVALDGELHREVALKQILEKHADDPFSRRRFVAEAEITGGLEHPGVVPVYGLGTYGGGRPYYAMRLIKGESFKAAIEHFHGDETVKNEPGRRSLELRKLLRRFLDVCNAIDYAHSRGVIHRDVKPANIILGNHGETLVVDWGLAKAIGRADPTVGEQTIVPSSSGSSETLPGSALGTPAYMSPEQASGDLDRLGPRSDVYSLGATFYCLLTGWPPFEGDDVGEVLHRVQAGDVRAPREVDPSLDRALEAICLKAMALKPAERYATGRALAEDIERWMADEPVGAWREPVWRRTRRWARRNRTAVTTAAAAVLVALAGTAIVLFVQTQANRDLRQANAQTRRERDQARRNFDLAQQNFELARKAVDDYLTRVGHDPLLKEQGLHALRQELLELALGYYRAFLAQRGDDPSLRVETAAAHERVGDIQNELGHPDEALATYDQALALIEPLVREPLGDPVLATAQVRLEAGRLQAFKDISDRDAVATFDRVKRLGEELFASGGGTDDLPDILAQTYAAAAIILRNTGRITDALEAGLRALELAERATQNRPGDLSAARTRLHASAVATDMMHTKGRDDEVRRVCEQEIAFGKARLREHPRDVEMRFSLAALEVMLGEIEKEKGRRIEALTLLRSSADTLGALARDNPLIVRVRSQWGISLFFLSTLEADLGRYADAQQSAQTSIEVLEACVRDVPSYPFYRVRLAYCYGNLGKVHVKRGSPSEGLQALRKSIAILQTSDELWAQYNQACFLALASTVADPAEGPVAAERQRRDADRAVATLRRVLANGFANSASLKTDPDLDSLRARPDFHALLTDLDFPADPFAH
jgi:serine/threonine-protein kinase